METNSGLTTNELISLVRLTGMVPDAPGVFKPEDIITLLNTELLIGMVPSIIQAKEEYFVFNIYKDLEANRSKYPIPSRAISNRLRDLAYLDSGGNEFQMVKIHTDDKYQYITNTVSDSQFKKFFLEASSVVLYPNIGPNPTGQLIFKIYIRPNKLVKNEEAGVISSINRTTGEIVLSNLPTKFTISSSFDFIKAGSPHNIIDIDKSITSIVQNTKTLTFSTTDIPVDLSVGDYICLAGETCIPNIPTELHPVLAQRVRHQILEAQGDAQGQTAAGQRLSEMEGKTSILIENRVDGSPTKIVSKSIMFGLGRGRSRTRLR